MRKAAVIIIMILAFISMVIPLTYWSGHPELTEMQMFIKFWYMYLITAALGISLIMFWDEELSN